LTKFVHELAPTVNSIRECRPHPVYVHFWGPPGAGKTEWVERVSSPVWPPL
jgi:Ni2+-binding GTPase involved in maturation of urease and hydrogenase